MGSESTTEELLDCLRASTREAHIKIERHPRMRLLLSPLLTLDDYIALLRDLLCWHATLDLMLNRQLRRLALEDEDYAWTPRRELLLRDLHDLDAPLATNSDLPSSDLPPLRTRDEIVGVLYVLEGATQGGKVISPLLERRLGVSDTRGGRYFSAFRHGVWEAFRAWLARMQVDGQIAAHTSRLTFQSLHQHLDMTSGRPFRARNIA